MNIHHCNEFSALSLKENSAKFVHNVDIMQSMLEENCDVIPRMLLRQILIELHFNEKSI